MTANNVLSRKSQKVHSTTKTPKNQKLSSPSSRPCLTRRRPTSQQLSKQLTDSESTTSDTAVRQDRSIAVAEKKPGKAAAQQRWYQKNRERERGKARVRVARARGGSDLFAATENDGYDDFDSTPNDADVASYESLDMVPPMETSPADSASPPVAPAPLRSISTHHRCVIRVPSEPPLLSPSMPLAELPRLVEHGTVISDFNLWESWSATERMTALRRWYLYAENRYGSLDGWHSQFLAEWTLMRCNSVLDVEVFLEGAKNKIEAGSRAIDYLGRVMEGYMPEDIRLWRDLYLQVHQYSTQIVSAVVGLQVIMDRVISEKG